MNNPKEMKKVESKQSCALTTWYISLYRKNNFLFLCWGESSPTRREAVKRKTAEYLMRAEKISSLYHKSSEDASVSMVGFNFFFF